MSKLQNALMLASATLFLFGCGPVLTPMHRTFHGPHMMNFRCENHTESCEAECKAVDSKDTVECHRQCEEHCMGPHEHED